MNIQDLDAKILIEFLVFECLSVEEFQKEINFFMVLNLIKLEYNRISKFLIDFIIDCMVLICLKRFSYLRDLTESMAIEEEKKYIKIIFQYFEFYMNVFPNKRNMVIKNIVYVYCFFVNEEREYCWKHMRGFLLNDPVFIAKYFLEIIYNELINNKFSTIEDYFYYDSDEEFGLPAYNEKLLFFGGLYKNFLFKVSDANGHLVKHKVKIIKGSIFFIGMSVWGYERIDKINIPNSIILEHFYKLINHSHKKIDQEIILCLRRLIKKYGDILSDEWNEIFRIMSMIISREKTTLSENSIKNIFEILDAIKVLIINGKFFGKISLYVNILDEFKYVNESLIMLKAKFKLANYYNFISNLESLIIEYLLK